MTGMAVLGYLFVIGRIRTLLVLPAVVRQRHGRLGRIGRPGVHRQCMRKLAERQPAQQERDDQPTVSIRTIHAKSLLRMSTSYKSRLRRSAGHAVLAVSNRCDLNR